jgi:putative ABC transport system ATP-binding protein
MSTELYSVEAAGRRYRVKGREITALDRIDCRIAKGDFVVVAGASGSGKSTLLMLLGGLLRPSAGRVLFEGVDLYAMDAARRAALRARRIGFVFQTFHLVPYLNALNNVLVPILSQAGTDRRALRQRALGLLETFGISDRGAHLPSELSVGQRQRVAMARALLLSPDILLADEPTGNLDAGATDQLMDSLRAFHANGGTVVLVTHHADLLRAGTASMVLDHGCLSAPP